MFIQPFSLLYGESRKAATRTNGQGSSPAIPRQLRQLWFEAAIIQHMPQNPEFFCKVHTLNEHNLCIEFDLGNYNSTDFMSKSSTAGNRLSLQKHMSMFVSISSICQCSCQFHYRCRLNCLLFEVLIPTVTQQLQKDQN